ncbi:MAG: proteasome accessory factor PafA2 family protein [Deltaproteobacteria bacterium]|nr:proteasome accessory factor PafA2 family protein [Deltaproteobacteria bacterium]
MTAVVRRPAARRPIVCGADVELGNFVVGLDDAPGLAGARLAARLLLHAIPGPYARPTDPLGWQRGWDPQDAGRKFLRTNGGCFYIDLDHLEACVPEIRSAWDHVAAWHAMLRIAAAARADAEALLPDGCTLQLLANNSDGRGNAYGSHVSFLVSRRLWNDLFERKLHQLLVLASFLASSVVVTGAGKVGAENGRPPVDYQLSQRADFFESLVGPQTTYRRPLVNSRDEPLCGTTGPHAASLARLHCIFFDATLCHGSTLLKIGTMQLLLGMLEQGRVRTDLVLEDPVAATVRWSHDPTLVARARLLDGRRLTAAELQLAFLDAAEQAAAAGDYEGVVPRAAEILALWRDTLERLRAGDVASLAPRLDWVLKRELLTGAMARRPGLGWTDPGVKHLDHLYASLDPADGLYLACERGGAVERFADEAAIARFVRQPPPDTRAFGRALLQRLGGRAVADVDWDRIAIVRAGPDGVPVTRTVHLDDPLGFTRHALGLMHAELGFARDARSFPRTALRPPSAGADSLDELLDALDATTSAWPDASSPLPPEASATGASEPAGATGARGDSHEHA